MLIFRFHFQIRLNSNTSYNNYIKILRPYDDKAPSLRFSRSVGHMTHRPRRLIQNSSRIGQIKSRLLRDLEAIHRHLNPYASLGPCKTLANIGTIVRQTKSAQMSPGSLSNVDHSLRVPKPEGTCSRHIWASVDTSDQAYY